MSARLTPMHRVKAATTPRVIGMTQGSYRVALLPREGPNWPDRSGNFVGRERVEGQRVDRALELVGERVHHQAVALQQRLASECRRDDARLPVIARAGEVLELDGGVGHRGADASDDVIG